MKSCDVCGTMILFGGLREGDLRFCGKKCLKRGQILIYASQLPEDEVYDEAMRLRETSCPRCHRDGPIDVHLAHWAYSMLSYTDWGSTQFHCCKRCGCKKQILNTLSTFVCGWWAPFGFLITPYQIGRNIKAMMAKQDPEVLSQPLWKYAQMQLAERMYGTQPS